MSAFKAHVPTVCSATQAQHPRVAVTFSSPGPAPTANTTAPSHVDVGVGAPSNEAAAPCSSIRVERRLVIGSTGAAVKGARKAGGAAKKRGGVGGRAGAGGGSEDESSSSGSSEGEEEHDQQERADQGGKAHGAGGTSGGKQQGKGQGKEKRQQGQQGQQGQQVLSVSSSTRVEEPAGSGRWRSVTQVRPFCLHTGEYWLSC